MLPCEEGHNLLIICGWSTLFTGTTPMCPSSSLPSMEFTRRCFPTPSPVLPTRGLCRGSPLLLLFPLQFVSSFEETELEASCLGCTVLSYQ